jgi:hypothetical protein
MFVLHSQARLCSVCLDVTMIGTTVVLLRCCSCSLVRDNGEHYMKVKLSLRTDVARPTLYTSAGLERSVLVYLNEVMGSLLYLAFTDHLKEIPGHCNNLCNGKGIS